MDRRTKVDIARELRRAGAKPSVIAEIMQASQTFVHGWLNDPDGKRKARQNAAYRQRRVA